jgi:hypothetical protein
MRLMVTMIKGRITNLRIDEVHVADVYSKISGINRNIEPNTISNQHTGK